MTLTDTSLMPFGKFEGERMAVMDYIEENKEVLEQEVKQGR